MNTYATYHESRRDKLMHAARVLKATRKPSPGSVAIMRDCVSKARLHNHLAMLHRQTTKG